MKLIDELYPDEKDITNFFSIVDWPTVGSIVESTIPTINEMPKDKAYKIAFDLFLVIAYHLNINAFEVLKKE